MSSWVLVYDQLALFPLGYCKASKEMDVVKESNFLHRSQEAEVRAGEEGEVGGA